MTYMLFDVLIPAAGSFAALCIFFAPFQDVRNMNSDSKLNPLSFSGIVLNCMSWVHYGYLQRNPWMMFPNAIGAVVSLWYCLVFIGIKGRNRGVEMLLVGGLAYLTLSASIAFLLNDVTSANTLLGLVANSGVIMLYGFPLITMRTVIRAKSSVSIHAGVAITSLLSGSLWFVYGLAINDPFVYICNGIGFVLSGIQVLLKFVYRNPAVKF